MLKILATYYSFIYYFNYKLDSHFMLNLEGRFRLLVHVPPLILPELDHSPL